MDNSINQFTLDNIISKLQIENYKQNNNNFFEDFDQYEFLQKLIDLSNEFKKLYFDNPEFELYIKNFYNNQQSVKNYNLIDQKTFTEFSTQTRALISTYVVDN